jgi:hypothetical protein
MVSEGVDIPRLRLGVFGTTTTTELFFRQAVGRFVRHTGGRSAAERAWLFIPDDPRLRTWAATIAEHRRHSLRRRWEDGQATVEDDEPVALDELEDGDEQLSLFSVLSSQVIDVAGPSVFDEGDHDEPDDELDDGSVPVELPAPPPPGASRWSLPLSDDLGGRSLPEVKRELRAANADLALDLVRFTGLTHREVNGRLNRLAGLERITEATLDQLRRRADQAERWIRSL